MPLTPDERRRNVEKVLRASERLRLVEQALADFEARVPSIRRMVQECREAIADAMAAARPGPEQREGGE